MGFFRKDERKRDDIDFREKAKGAYRAASCESRERINRYQKEREEMALRALKRIAGKDIIPDEQEDSQIKIDGITLHYSGGYGTGERFYVEGRCKVCGEEGVWSMPCATLAEIGEQLEHFHPDYDRHKHLR